MVDEANAVTFTVDGLDYGGWKTVEITAGLERQAREFSLGITWRWPGHETGVGIKLGAKCQVRIGRDLVLTGWVFANPVSYDSGQVTVSVSGRSLTADLVDCAAVNKPGQWVNQGVLSIVKALAAPYGLAVRSEVSDTATLSDHTIEPGETAFESIDRLLTLFRTFSTDDELGTVVLALPGSRGRCVDSIEVGRNVLSSSAGMDFSGVFSEYQVIGQRSGTDETFGKQVSEVSASVSDPRITRSRTLIIHESGQLTPELAASRANWERGHRMGKAMTATYKVHGWRQANGELWRHNTIVRVKDPVIGFDRDMLISEVTYSLSDEGTITTLVVGPPDSFLPEPHDPHKKRKIKKTDKFEYLLPADWDKQ